MTEQIGDWISNADALHHLEHFHCRQIPLGLGVVRSRTDDYYISLIGEIFERLRVNYEESNDWARLGNAFLQIAGRESSHLDRAGINSAEARLFAGAAFYFGGFPASACLAVRAGDAYIENDVYQACYDFLARPSQVSSNVVASLIAALQEGNQGRIESIRKRIGQLVESSLARGPSQWIPNRLLQFAVDRFATVNLRAVLPDGDSDFWNPLVDSFLDQTPPSWEFFPSQIEAISKGILTSVDTYSLQMPTGSGKTALCETMLFHHLSIKSENVAVVIVPYRSLASELRGSLVRRLGKMGIPCKATYGGTVMIGNDRDTIDEVKALVATPETLTGILSANPSFFKSISLVICDEGHLLDGGSRGILLELLLARLKAKRPIAPRFVFISAIVPNIDEINTWLGGSDATVVKSNYQPSMAEFAVLRKAEGEKTLDLEMHPHKPPPIRYRIEEFLSREDFAFRNPKSGRINIYTFSSVKTRAVASARKALPMGAVAVFASNKRGSQGSVGLAEELLKQLETALDLPTPATHCDSKPVQLAWKYVSEEYGSDWIVARVVESGAVLHHGDIPQETREVLENLLRRGASKFAICTSTLAEGVNLPIRTLVLYSVKRRDKDGSAQDLLERDIKNLVGRAGRAGATTKGLVICANEQQWPIVAPVANQSPGEVVKGALLELVNRIKSALAARSIPLTNDLLEGSPPLFSLTDGVDATLIELAAEEIGESDLLEMATRIADQTFAAAQTEEGNKQVLRNVFRLRSTRIIELRDSGKLSWVRDTGARVRIIPAVEDVLFLLADWQNITVFDFRELIATLFDWARTLTELEDSIRVAYDLKEESKVDNQIEMLKSIVWMWMQGNRFVDISKQHQLPMDDLLRIYTSTISFTLQTIVEQAIAILSKLAESRGLLLSSAARRFPEHLRFGALTETSCILAAEGLRHRRSYVKLGSLLELQELPQESIGVLCTTARDILIRDEDFWKAELGELVYANTILDLEAILDK